MILRVFSLITIIISFAYSDLFNFYKIYQAKSAYKSGDYNRSLKIFKNIKQDNPIYNYNLANSYYKAKKYKMAIIYYKRAFGDGVDEANRLYNLGNAYFKLNQLDNAIIAYENSLKLKKEPDTKYNLELAKLLKQKNKKKSKSKKQKDKKDAKKKNKKKLSKKLTKKELKKLKELEKKNRLKKELKKYIKKSLKSKKLPVLMYKIQNGNEENLKNPW